MGPWLPYQMLCAGFVGLFAGLLPKATGRAELALLAAYGVVSAFAYGWLMDFSFWPFAIGDGTQLSFDPDAGPLENLHRFVLFNLATSMGWNLGRALSNAVLIALLGTPLLRLFRRSARTAELVSGDPTGREPVASTARTNLHPRLRSRPVNGPFSDRRCKSVRPAR